MKEPTDVLTLFKLEHFKPADDTAENCYLNVSKCEWLDWSEYGGSTDVISWLSASNLLRTKKLI